MRWFTQPMLDRLNARTGQTFTSALFTTDWDYIRCMFELNDNIVLLRTDHGLMLGIYDRSQNERLIMEMAEEKTAQSASAVPATTSYSDRRAP